jgi:hypothetical protein
MTHKNDFVACIKANGKILREQNQQVAVPFGSEYSILVKNLKSVRAMVEITIDGESVTDNQKLILNDNSEIDLERYIKNGNLSKGNKFRFIERTEEIENHRGIKASDGLVRIEFWPEKITHQTITWPNYPYYENWPTKTRPTYPKYPNDGVTFTKTDGNYNGILRQYQNTVHTTTCENLPNQVFTMNCSVNTNPEPKGITVPGSESNQTFVYGSNFDTESLSTVIVFQLVGKSNEQVITRPVTVQTKPKCITCGRQNKAVNKFCSQCGTSLILF